MNEYTVYYEHDELKDSPSGGVEFFSKEDQAIVTATTKQEAMAKVFDWLSDEGKTVTGLYATFREEVHA